MTRTELQSPWRILPLLLMIGATGCDSSSMGDDAATGADAGAVDAEVLPDAASPDAGREDAGLQSDAGLPDAGFPVDAGAPVDAGFPDAGLPDTGLPDAGSDAGLPDAGSDAGFGDAGSDAGGCGGPCTARPAECDGATRVSYSGGRCEGDACVYEATRTDCMHGCDSGACLGDPCEGKTLCPAEAAFMCVGDLLQTCELDVDGCLVWSEGAACPAGPEDSSPECTESGCSFVCDMGFESCEGRCIPEGQRCGVALPDGACTSSEECGAGQACIDDRCDCIGRRRVCASGCCPYELVTTEFPGIVGTGLDLAYAPDGTAYFAVRQSVVGGDYVLRLYSLAPGATDLALETFSREVTYYQGAFAIEVRSDGVLFAAVHAGHGGAVLWRWAPGDAAAERVTGLSGGTSATVGLTIDPDDTVWMNVGTSSAFDPGVVSVEVDGTVTFIGDTGAMSDSAEADIEWNPATGGIYAYWGHNYTGGYRKGIIPVAGSPEISSCEGRDVAFGPEGLSWSIYNAYPTITTQICRDRRRTSISDLHRTFPDRAEHLHVDVDAEGTAFFVFRDGSSIRWVAGRDGDRWTTSGVAGSPIGFAFPSLAVTPDGEMVFAVLPDRAEDGTLRLITQ